MNAFLETRNYHSGFPVSSFSATDNHFLAHWHIDVEMVFVCKGSIRIGVNRESRILHQGEMAVFGSTDIHYYDSKDLNSTVIILIFRPELVGSPGGWPENHRFEPAFMDLKRLDLPIRRSITGIFYSIANETNHHPPYYQLYVSGKIMELCALLQRSFPTCNHDSRKKTGKMPDVQKIHYAIQFLQDNYMNEISLEDISARSNLSPYYFSRLFARFTGMNFKEYLNRIRIEKAENLIKANRKSIIDISFECGFNSVRTFNRTYKAIKGIPPTKARPGD